MDLRPITGMVSMNTFSMVGKNFQSTLATMLHEVAHVMGFSGDDVASFVDSNGIKLTTVIA